MIGNILFMPEFLCRFSGPKANFVAGINEGKGVTRLQIVKSFLLQDLKLTIRNFVLFSTTIQPSCRTTLFKIVQKGCGSFLHEGIFT